MAPSRVGQQAETTPQTVRELRIEISRDEWAQYEGTAAQLQDEGLIPKDFEWPQAAADSRWEATYPRQQVSSGSKSDESMR